MGWLSHSSGWRWLILLLALLASTTAEGGLDIHPSAPHESTESAFTTIISTDDIPSTTLATDPTPTPTSGPTLPPDPEPIPEEYFVNYTNSTIFLTIGNITVKYEDTTFFTTSLTSMTIINSTLAEDKDTIIFKRYYSLKGKEQFFVQFIFMRNSTSHPSWYIQNFMHENLTEAEGLLFQYRGIRSIMAPINKTYQCSNIELHGTTGESDDPITSTLLFENIHIQAFIKNGKVSNESVVCGEEPKPLKELNLGLVIGVVAGVCSAALILAIIIAAVVVVKKSRQRGYDLLSD